MNKTKQFLLCAAGAMLSLGIGACHSDNPPEDNTPPVSQRPKPAQVANGGAPGGPGAPGAMKQAGQPSPTAGKPPAQAGKPPVAGAPGAQKGNKPTLAQQGAKTPGQPPTPGAPGKPTDPFAGKALPSAKPGAETAAIGRPVRTNKDPFYVTWHVQPPPPYVFLEIEPVRVADDDVELPPVKPVTVREEPMLRVSGIMTGDGVFAILEQSGGQVDIVKPGSTVNINTGQTNRSYKVVSINDDKVTLESKEGNFIFTQVVPLSDAPAGTGAQPRGFPGGPGGMGMPGNGGFPGSGGRPGVPRSGGPVGGAGPAGTVGK
ncbi:MAG TPA: hypothetical protein VKU00_31135 [Chthonomonadaceae bacterium]|nr:hypothetical protein [Chthonomonadaceae bacterium]